MPRNVWIMFALALVAPLMHATPAWAAFPADTDSFLHVVGFDRRDFDQAHTWTAESDNLRWSGTSQQISVRGASDANGSRPSIDVEFRPPFGDDLGAGVYENAADYHDALPYTDRATIALHGSACGMQRGRFEILQLDLERNQLWMTFHVECEDRDVFGEIKINQPRDASGLSVVPSRIDWPPQYPDVPERDVVVQLTNNGVEPMTVDEVTVSQGSEAFSVLDHDCAVLTPASSCAVRVGFTPATAGPVSGLLTVRDSTTGRSTEVPLSGGGIAGVTGIQLRSEPGDGTGVGEDHRISPEEIVVLEGYDTRVRFWSPRWDVGLTAPRGHVLAPGQTFSTEQGAAVWVSGPNHRTCEDGYGRIRVHDAAYDAAGQMRRFNAEFVYGCEGRDESRVHGSMAYRSKFALKPLPPRVDLEVKDKIYTYGEPLPVTITLDDSVQQRRVAVVTSGKRRDRVLGEFTVRRGGTVSGTVPLPRRSGYITLRGVDPDRDVASDVALVSVARRVTVRLAHPTGTDGKFAVYPAHGYAPVRVRVAPDPGFGHVRVAVQAKDSSGLWRWVMDRFRVEVVEGVAEFSLSNRRALRNRPIRLSAVYPSVNQVGPGRSPWSHLVFGDRRG